ncbi:glycosyltransferase [Enorma phocaeensis]|uniref:glycosyltransferase n=1 Tax=Enorma phocaeensis TaxID=1871019 RepID=UPI002356715F|nr:glycosyltransferase [Enorma phocaeensis]
MAKATQYSGFYLACFGIGDSGDVLSGVEQKVRDQLDCFNNCGLHCSYIHCKLPRSRVRRGLGSLPGVSDGVAWPSAARLRGADYIYIRRPLFSTREFLALLRDFRFQNPAAKIIIEIPTYPYDQLLMAPELFFAYRKERKYREMWKLYVDRIADLSLHSEIFGIPTIPIVNGIDLELIDTRTPSYSPSREINIVFTAYFEKWHGCDLLLQGLFDYYLQGGKRSIRLHLAGGGSELQNLKELASRLNLNDRVLFYGELDKDSSSKLFDKCTLAVGGLGSHRIGLGVTSTLKTREYLARGIPFFYAGDIDVLMGKESDFFLRFDSSEKPVDFNAVVKFHDELYDKYDERDMIADIRHFAEQTVSIQVGMREVVKYIKS